jgi:hypothetical protein
MDSLRTFNQMTDRSFCFASSAARRGGSPFWPLRPPPVRPERILRAEFSIRSQKLPMIMTWVVVSGKRDVIWLTWFHANHHVRHRLPNHTEARASACRIRQRQATAGQRINRNLLVDFKNDIDCTSIPLVRAVVKWLSFGTSPTVCEMEREERLHMRRLTPLTLACSKKLGNFRGSSGFRSRLTAIL